MFSSSIAKGSFTVGVMLLGCGIYAQVPFFSYEPPGQLVPGSGQGRNDSMVYLRGMRFPLEEAPAYANSQVWGLGGLQNPGDQCAAQNYSYPWQDNYCETRSSLMPYCPTGRGHQGQDIRPATCTDGAHWAVAVEAGTIISIGSYSVSLLGKDSRIRHRYLHLDHDRLAVTEGQEVDRGERIGLVSDNYGSGSTTIHLHFDMRSEEGKYIPTYMSLVRSYQELLGVSRQ